MHKLIWLPWKSFCGCESRHSQGNEKAWKDGTEWGWGWLVCCNSTSGRLPQCYLCHFALGLRPAPRVARKTVPDEANSATEVGFGRVALAQFPTFKVGAPPTVCTTLVWHSVFSRLASFYLSLIFQNGIYAFVVPISTPPPKLQGRADQNRSSTC